MQFNKISENIQNIDFKMQLSDYFVQHVQNPDFNPQCMESRREGEGGGTVRIS